ncbi:MAG TPA: alpha-ribazole phosphatase family protein [Puia sp.]|nr:alpha-ribazole phosphatase family protein [Puia sp.]
MIYLIRHTTPLVARGMCYGQTDLDVAESFPAEAAMIRKYLPQSIGLVYSSPLRRCTLLADELFPGRPLRLAEALMEIHCGKWEMRAWDDLPAEEIDPWMADFVRVRIPGGESYVDLHQRVGRCWEEIRQANTAKAAANGAGNPGDIAVVAHGGVIRSILARISNTALTDSFKAFSPHYGCVIRVFEDTGGWQHEMLWNQAPTEKEQHKPKSFYR